MSTQKKEERKVTVMNPKDVHMANLHKVLENAKCSDSDYDHDLAAHLKKVFGFLILNYPGQALQKFEEVSLLLKEGKDISKYLRIADDRNYTAVA
jgi:DNA relaxase NicK